MIVDYLPISSLLNFKLCSKDFNYDYQFSKEKLSQLYRSNKIYNNSAAFKSYLRYHQPIGADFEQAVERNKADILKILLEDSRSVSFDYNQAIIDASEFGYIEIVRILLNDKRGDPSAYDNCAIRFAAENGHIEIVKMLLDDERVDPSGDSNYAIRNSSKNGHTEIVRVLLADERVDPTAFVDHSIGFASTNGHAEITKMLLDDERADPSAYDNYAIKFSSKNGHVEIVRMLLEDERVDPSAYDNYAIRCASKNGHTKVVEMLLNDGRLRMKSGTIKTLLESGLNKQMFEMLKVRLDGMEQSTL
ncbi:ankyrin repeat-containing domain protein [Globomyces pollinis-pini]|nr:ankyrin repeat-containing domain protein [Globomyces pollinis-pini]